MGGGWLGVCSVLLPSVLGSGSYMLTKVTMLVLSVDISSNTVLSFRVVQNSLARDIIFETQ